MARRGTSVVLVGVVLLAMCSACLGQAYVPGEVLVKFRPGTPAASEAAAHSAVGGRVIRTLPGIGVEHVQLGPAAAVPAALRVYGRNPNVVYAEPNYIVYAVQLIPNDPDFSQLWGLHNTGQTGGTADADIDAPEAWGARGTGDGSIVVGVIDTGVDYNHVDLAANIWTNALEWAGSNGVDDDGNGFVDDIHGYDFVNGDGDPMDDNGHGTHVSGTIGAIGNNGIGVAGVNWNVKVMALKFLNAAGSGSSTNAILALNYAAQMGAHLTSNSWGGGGSSQAMRGAIANAGTLFVAAAGNDGLNNDAAPFYPSSYDLANIISVAASDHNDFLASFSNYGLTSVDLAAPGVNIRSTVPGNSYASYDGTSMATPHVAGAAALIQATLGESGAAAKTRLLATVDHKPAFDGRMVSGGRLNLYSALTTPGGPALRYDHHDIVSDTDSDGRPEPGEGVTMTVTLANDWQNATNVSAALAESDPYVTVTQPSASYGNIPGGGTGTSAAAYAFSVAADCPGGHIVTFDLAITFDGGSDSESFDVVIFGRADVLFVDDDAGGSYESYFTSALGASGYSYLTWNVATQGSPAAADLAMGRAVVWTTGADWSTTLSTYDQNQLSAYLDGGGKLFLSSQDVLWDIGLTAFMRSYMHVQSYTDDIGAFWVSGVSADPISDGFDMVMTYPYSDYTDWIEPDAQATFIFYEALLTGWPVGLRYPSADAPAGGGSTVFLAFPFEGVPASDRNLLMQRILDWLLGGGAPPNDAPVAADDPDYRVNEDNTLNAAAPGVLANDFDPDGDPLTAILVNDVGNGSLTLNADGSFVYTPDLNFNGTDTFTYRASDGLALSTEATATIAIAPVNDAPVADAQSVTTPAGTAVGIILTASDVDGDPLTFSVVTGPSRGSLSGTAPNLTYTPAPGFTGPDSFTFKANDGAADSNVAVVDITVTAVTATGTVIGRVILADGSAAGRANVTLIQGGSTVASTQAGRDGRFTLSGVPGGVSSQVQAKKGKRTGQSGTFTSPPGGTLDIGNVTIQ